MTDPRLRFLSGAARDTDRVLDSLDSPTVTITAPSLAEWRHQVLLITLVDLLGRVFPRIELQGDTDRVCLGSADRGSTVASHLAEVRRRSPIDPLDPGRASITIQVGPGLGDADVYVDASEWQTYLGRRPSRLLPPRRDTAIGPVVAACRAAARVHSTLLASLSEPPTFDDETYASTLSYRSSSDPLDDPAPPPIGDLNAILVGVGSVGGAAMYTIAHEPMVRGRVEVCDPQDLEAANPYRAVLATAVAAAKKLAKVDAAAAAVAHHEDLVVSTFRGTISEWEAAHPDPPVLPLTLVAVDSLEARESIQDALPMDVVNVGVDSRLVAISGHRTGAGPCMCCLHIPEILDARSIKNRLIADGTGIEQSRVNVLRVQAAKLDKDMLRGIERHRHLGSGTLDHYVGSSLDDLYDAEILYGETEVATSSGTRVAVAAPYVTTFAGALLAAEAFKRSTPALVDHALGPGGIAIQAREDPYTSSPALLDSHLERSRACVCRSTRRLRLTAELYDVPVAELTG